MSGECAGKVALVTGGSRGIGKAIAMRLAAEGAAVCVTGRSGTPGSHALPGSLAETVQQIEAAGGRAMAVPADLSDAALDRARIVHAVEDHFQAGVDILVNNAAAPRTFQIGFLEMTRALFAESVEVNAWAAWELGQLVAAGMRDRGAGWILNISSRSAGPRQGPPYPPSQVRAQVLYGATKAMLDRITTGAAMELYDHGIAVNALAPESAVLTENAASVVSLAENVIEPVEAFAEASLALCTCDPRVTTGRVAYSLSLLVELARPVRTLDGQDLVPGWQPHEIDPARLRRGYLDPI
jgi:NAD(P)-dependent dehydrogenase (short-subunit alcohol dehydrogenase family)